MSTFCTVSTFDFVLIGSTLDAATVKLLNQKIQLSESTIKGRLSKRYDLTSYDTSTAVPPQLRTLCELLTEGFYYKSMSRGNEKAFKRGESMCKMALDELKMLQKR